MHSCQISVDAIHTSLCNLGSTNVLLEEMDVYLFGVNFGVKYIPLQECKRESKGIMNDYIQNMLCSSAHQKRTWRHEIRRMRQKNRTGRIPCSSSFAKPGSDFYFVDLNFFSFQATLYSMSQKCSTRSEKLLQDWLLMTLYPTSTDKEKTSCWLKN